jgi:hypothetical protein
MSMKSAKKTAKKAAPKKVVKKKVAVKKQSLPIEDFYRVDIEQCGPNNTRILRTHVSFKCVDENTAREGMEGCKTIGIGGQLVKLDGTPDGALIERWASIEDVENALATEVNESDKPPSPTA